MKTFLFLIAIAFLLLPVFVQGVCNNLFATVSPDGQHLYFCSDRHGGNYEIYSSDLDGKSNLVRLTHSSVNNLYPNVSPDGSKIVFQRDDYGSNAEVFIMNADGSGLIQLTNNSIYDGYPHFSPDGLKLVFDGWDTEAYPEIFTMDLNGNERTQLTNFPGADWQCSPMYSPEGDFIYFSIGYNADLHLARMDVTGLNIIDITPPNPFGIMEFGMSFSPDANHIIFSTMEWTGYNNGCDIVVADMLGNNWNRLTNAVSGEWFHSPYWNLVDSMLYYSYNNSALGYWQIYEMTASGTDATLLTDCFNVGVQENHLTDNNLSAYPVPLMNELNLSMPAGYYVELYDVLGNLVIRSYEDKIDMASFRSGFYFIRFFDRSGMLVQTLKVCRR